MSFVARHGSILVAYGNPGGPVKGSFLCRIRFQDLRPYHGIIFFVKEGIVDGS